MELVVQSTGVAHCLASGVASPQGSGGSRTVGTGDAALFGNTALLLGPGERPVGAVHLGVQSTSVTQEVSIGVSAPERS